MYTTSYNYMAINDEQRANRRAGLPYVAKVKRENKFVVIYNAPYSLSNPTLVQFVAVGKGCNGHFTRTQAEEYAITVFQKYYR